MFRNHLSTSVGETAGVTQDVGSDPTVGLPLCLLCGAVVLCEGRMTGVDGGAVDDSHQEKLISSPEKLNKDTGEVVSKVDLTETAC